MANITDKTTINPTLTFNKRVWGVLTGKESRLRKLYKLSSELAGALIQKRKPGHIPIISLDHYRFLAENISSQLKKHGVENVCFSLKCSSFSANNKAKVKILASAIRIALRELGTNGLTGQERICVINTNNCSYQCELSIIDIEEKLIAIITLKLRMPDPENLDEIRGIISANPTWKPLFPS
ncbi:MAG: hypothetical protein ABIH69_01130 [bacterium]